MSFFDLPAPSGSGTKPDLKAPQDLLDLSLLNGMDVHELVQLRQAVDERLPVRSLRDLNMEQELVIQLVTAQRLQRDVLADEETPANQRAQTLNAVAAALATLAKLQVEVYNSERLKRVEQVLIEVLQTLPMEAQEQFLALYEKELG